MVNDEVVSYIDKVYIMLNKPKGYISATEDEVHPTIIDLIPEYAHLNIFSGRTFGQKIQKDYSLLQMMDSLIMK